MAGSQRSVIALGILLLLSFSLYAQQHAQQPPPQLTRIDENEANIRLDGFIDEAVWEGLPVLDGMQVIDPDTLAPAPYETHIRVFYTEDGISMPASSIISRLTFQARYRWEIAPLSDLFVVYTRGGNLSPDSFKTFQELFEQSWNDPIVDSVAIKLRYRFGS